MAETLPQCIANTIIFTAKASLKVIYFLLNIKPYYNLQAFFFKVGLKNKQEKYPKLIKVYESKKGYTYLFACPTGLAVSDFNKYKGAIEIQLKEKVEIRERKGYVEIEVKTVKLPTQVEYRLPQRNTDSIYIPFGEGIEKTVAIDLAENPHSYLVGTTGSGKSVCTKGILTTLVNNYTSSEVELYLCDLKMVELALFRELKHTKSFVCTVEETIDVISDLLEETKARYDLFMQNEVTSIFEYNKIKGVKKLKYQVIFIEEVVMLLEDPKKKAMKLLKQLIAISRASGCYVFITTQRPSVDVLDNVVKANINNRICFKVEDEKNSNICLDSSEAKDLRGKGHGILKVGSNKTEFQSYFISDEQVKEHIKPFVIKKKVEKEPYEKYKNKKDTNKVKEKTNKAKNEVTDLSFLDKI